MGRIVRLRTSEGGRVRIVLENWGCGLDHLRRRWVRADGYWECMDTGRRRAEESRSSGTKVFSDPNPAPVADQGRVLLKWRLP
jgi:hypothetical protein